MNLFGHNLDDPDALTLNHEMFAGYRKQRLAGDFTANLKYGMKKIPKETTVNREHAYLRAVFKELKRLERWKGDNPLDGVRLFRESENELAFLYEEDIKRLLHGCYAL